MKASQNNEFGEIVTDRDITEITKQIRKLSPEKIDEL